MQEGDQEEEAFAVVLSSAPLTTYLVESVVAHYSKGTTHCIPEEILGIDRELPEATRKY